MKEERRKLTAQIEQDYRSLVESIKDYAIFMLDKKGKITSWNQGGVKLFGYKRNEIIGKSFSILFTKDDAAKKIPKLDMAAAVEETRHLDERQYLRKNQTKFWSSGVLTANRDKKGIHRGFSKIMRDVTQQNELHKTAVHNSTHDFLTGLPNRNFFEESLVKSISATKKGDILAVLYMDFNNFKRTNDERGHQTGDLVLIEIAHRLSHNIRLSDITARFGGDEFVILAKQLKNNKDVASFTKKILKAFNVPIVIDKKKIHTSVSVGVALYPSDAEKPSELLRYADLALYQAKKRGGNQYQLYTESLSPQKILKNINGHNGKLISAVPKNFF